MIDRKLIGWSNWIGWKVPFRIQQLILNHRTHLKLNLGIKMAVFVKFRKGAVACQIYLGSIFWCINPRSTFMSGSFLNVVFSRLVHFFLVFLGYKLKRSFLAHKRCLHIKQLVFSSQTLYVFRSSKQINQWKHRLRLNSRETFFFFFSQISI